MINVLTGEFPIVEFGLDPNDRRLTEVQRRQKFLAIIPESKEKDLIIRCLSNNPDNRPSTDELVNFFKGTELEEGLFV